MSVCCEKQGEGDDARTLCENGVFVVLTCMVFLEREEASDRWKGCERECEQPPVTPFSPGIVCLVLLSACCTLPAGRSEGLCPA